MAAMLLADQCTCEESYTGDSDLAAVWHATTKLTNPRDVPSRSHTAHERTRPFSRHLSTPSSPSCSASTLENPSPEPHPVQRQIEDPLATPPSPQSRIDHNAFDPSTNHTPGLLDLPPEIRRQIYAYLPNTVIKNRPLIYCTSHFSNRKQHPLAASCRLLRAEMLSTVYSMNTWVIALEYDMLYEAFRSWIASVGRHATHLRILQIGLRSPLLTSTRSQRYEGKSNASHNPLAQPEGEAKFEVDLSEKWHGGRVRTLRTDGDPNFTEAVRGIVIEVTKGLWEKKNKTEEGMLATDVLEMTHTLMDWVATKWWYSYQSGQTKSVKRTGTPSSMLVG